MTNGSLHGGGQLPHFQFVLPGRKLPVDQLHRLSLVIGDSADVPLIAARLVTAVASGFAVAAAAGRAAPQRRKNGNGAAVDHLRPAHEKVDREGGADLNAAERAAAAAGEGHGKPGRYRAAGPDGGEEKTAAGQGDADEKGAEKPFAVVQPHGDQGRSPVVNFLRDLYRDRQAGDISAAEDAGYRHEAEQRRDQQIKQVVAGIDRGKAEEQSHDDVDGPGPGEAQASGTGTS